MIRLYITPDGQQPYLLSFERAHIGVGSAADNEVRLQGPGVSGRHFVLRRVGVDVVIEDCNSRNGTYVNRLKLTAPKVLGAEDVIQVVGFQVKLVAEVGQTASASSPVSGGVTAKTRVAPVSPVVSVREVRGAAGAGPAQASAPGVALDLHGVGGAGPAQASRQEAAGEGRGAAAAEKGAPAVREQEGGALPPGVDPARVAAVVGPRAQAWYERADQAHLLRGEELHEARLWSASGERVQPPARRREQELIAASVVAAGRQGRRRLQVAAAWLAAAVVGGWTARSVLAGGLDAYAPGLSRRGVEQFQERLTAARRTACLESSARAAEAARSEARGSVEAGLARATEGLRCVAEFADLRGTEAERAVRELLGAIKGYTLERGEGAVRHVAADPSGRTVAWGRGDGSVVVWSVERWSGSVHEVDGTPLVLLALAADGRRLVAVSEGGQVRVWDLRDEAAGAGRVSLERPRGDVGAAALSADGRRLVIASASQAEVRAFDLDAAASPAPAVRLLGLAGPADRVVVSADGGRVFAASGASLVGWRLGGDRVLGKPQALAGHASGITAMSLATCAGGQEERWLLTGDAGGGVRMWELRGRGRVALTGVQGGVRALQATAGCRELVAAGLRDLRVWDLRVGEPDKTPRAIQVGAPIEALALDGGRALVAAGTKLAVYDLAGTLTDEYAGHTQAIGAMSLAEQSGWVVTGASDGTARLWDVRASAGLQSAQAHHAEPVRALATSEDGKMLVAAGAGARLWQIQGVQPPRVLLSALPGLRQTVKAAALSPNGLWAATAADAETLLVLWRVGDARPDASPPTQIPAEGPLSRLSFSDDNSWLVGSGPEATCAVDLRGAGIPGCVGFGGAGEVDAQAFIPGTHRVAFGTDDRDVRIADLDDLARTQSLGRGKGRVRSLVGSPDGRWLVAFGENVDGRLWDLKAPGSPATQLGALVETTHVALFTPDRQWLVVGTGPKLLAWRLAQLDTSPALVRDGLTSSVTALAVSPDGATLLTGGADGTVSAWDFARLADTAPVEFGRHREKVGQVAVSADGTLAVSAGKDATVHVWPLTGQRLWQLASRVHGGGRTGGP